MRYIIKLHRRRCVRPGKEAAPSRSSVSSGTRMFPRNKDKLEHVFHSMLGTGGGGACSPCTTQAQE